uniref:Uncharacterized protein n=1 Tax=Oryza sativa subsp. japonica TaxID=39947 RepID=Q69PU9_ORYSJ|nr:hypothetical protein [Oryza sativa Japonica Group]
MDSPATSVGLFPPLRSGCPAMNHAIQKDQHAQRNSVRASAWCCDADDGLGVNRRRPQQRGGSAGDQTEAANSAFKATTGFPGSSASGRWLPGFFSFLRTKRRQWRPNATMDDDERRGWSGGRRLEREGERGESDSGDGGRWDLRG